MSAAQDEAADGVPAARRPSRRDLLLGGGGLVIGAAGAGVGTALATGNGAGPGVGPKLPSPGEELMTEHGVLKRVLLAYRAITERLDGGRTVGTGIVVDAAQLVADYVESFHEGLEEAYVFPRVADRQPTLVRTLLVQHDRGRHLTAATHRLASDGDLRRPATRSKLSAALASFVRMYEPHEAWEDTVVYPELRRVSSQRTLDLLAERFADMENEQFGDNALAQMLDRLRGVEQQLGIHDLATFTPEPP